MMQFSGLILLLLIVAIPPVVALASIVVGLQRRSADQASSGTVFLSTGMIILLIYLGAWTAFLMKVGPGRSGILVQGFSPAGQEYCVVQTYRDLIEPYQVSFYIRDAQGIWRWSYLEHEDDSWRSAAVEFIDGTAHVSRNGVPFCEISLPTDTVDLKTVLPGYRHKYRPASFTAEDVLEYHNKRYRD